MRMYMKKIADVLAWLFCSSWSLAAPWLPGKHANGQPTAVTDFKSVAGKWEGLQTSNDPRVINFDRATLVIDDTGACETAITRTRTRV
jgi:hypothetical protein